MFVLISSIIFHIKSFNDDLGYRWNKKKMNILKYSTLNKTEDGYNMFISLSDTIQR